MACWNGPGCPGMLVQQLLEDPPASLQDFTPAEQACISRKIGLLIDEGKPRDQAVAIAIASCAPKKVRNSDFRNFVLTLAEELSDGVFFEDVPGGKYVALQNPDGTWDITSDVPIMATIPAGEKGNEEEIGEEWMLETLRLHKLQEQEGHLSPVHVYHHDNEGDKREFAGLFRLVRVGILSQRGETVPALFANLIRVPNSVFKRMRNLELPFRSVEMYKDWGENEISTLALLSDEPPHFKMPMTSIGHAVPFEGAVLEEPTEVVRFTPHESPAVAMFRGTRGGAAVLFNFRGTKMPRTTKKKTGKKTAKMTAEEEALVKLQQDDENSDDDKEELQEASIKEAVEALRGVAPLMAEIKKLLTTIAGGGGEEEDERDTSPVPAKAGEGDGTDPKVTLLEGTVGKLAGELAVIKGERTAEKKARVKSSAVDAAMIELKGYNTPGGIRETMVQMCEGVEEPKVFLEHFVKTVKESCVKEGPATLSELESEIAGLTDADEVLKFGQGGPLQLERAKKHARTFNELKEAGVFMDEDVTLESFVKDQLAREDRELERLGKKKTGS